MSVNEADLATQRRMGHSEIELLTTRTNLANCLYLLGRTEDCLRMRREIFADSLRLNGPDDEDTIIDALALVRSLINDYLYEEARTLVRDVLPRSRRTLGNGHYLTLDLQCEYACAISLDAKSPLGDVREAVAILEEAVRTIRRIMGAHHPDFAIYRGYLESASMRLADDESREA